MDNLTATRQLCNAICNTFYPDAGALKAALFHSEINPQAEAIPKDVNILRVAVRLVAGYVEGSRSEGGVSTGVRSEEAIRKSIMIWCGFYGVDADEILDGFQTTIDDVTDLW